MKNFIQGLTRWIIGFGFPFFAAWCWLIVFNQLVAPALGLADASYMAVFAVTFVAHYAIIPPTLLLLASFKLELLKEQLAFGEYIVLFLILAMFHMLIATTAVVYGYLFF